MGRSLADLFMNCKQDNCSRTRTRTRPGQIPAHPLSLSVTATSRDDAGPFTFDAAGPCVSASRSDRAARPPQPIRRSNVGRAFRNSLRRTSTADASPAHTLASAASASCDSVSVKQRRLELEPPVPADRRGGRALGLKLGQEDQVLERVDEREAAHLPGRDLGAAKVALCECAGEASVCRALGSHRRKGPAAVDTTSLAALGSARVYARISRRSPTESACVHQRALGASKGPKVCRLRQSRLGCRRTSGLGGLPAALVRLDDLHGVSRRLQRVREHTDSERQESRHRVSEESGSFTLARDLTVDRAANADLEFQLPRPMWEFIYEGVNRMPEAGRLFQSLGFLFAGIAATAAFSWFGADKHSDRVGYGWAAIGFAVAAGVSLLADLKLRHNERLHASWVADYMERCDPKLQKQVPQRAWWRFSTRTSATE